MLAGAVVAADVWLASTITASPGSRVARGKLSFPCATTATSLGTEQITCDRSRGPGPMTNFPVSRKGILSSLCYGSSRTVEISGHRTGPAGKCCHMFQQPEPSRGRLRE